MSLEIIVLAAGRGERMRSDLPKVLHPIGGKPMLLHLIETTVKLKPDKIHIVVGHGRQKVIDCVENRDAIRPALKIVNWVNQAGQKGTGHAVMQALPEVKNDASVLIVNGDTPLISIKTLRRIIRRGRGVNLLTVSLDDPGGMGRIIRDGKNRIVGIVEEKDASDGQKKIREINTNCICAPAGLLKTLLPRLDSDNAQNEYYLTDFVGDAVKAGAAVNAVSPQTHTEILGVNDKKELHRLERIYQNLAAAGFMEKGVTFYDSARFDLRGTCQFGNDCVVDINVILEGRVKIGNNVVIGPNSMIRNSTIGENCVIEAGSVIDNAAVGDNCSIGPFARIRPGTRLKEGVRIGNFVEIKKSTVGPGSKINHLAYIGDSGVGKDTNIGAGVITCNYDGVNKHRTVIGNNVFVGSDSQLIAPVKIADGSTIGAGSTITDNVAADSLAVSRGKQTTLKNWKRPGKN